MADKPSVLFLCTGNSCRSQMAEGWSHHLLANQFVAYSAGIETHGLNGRAVQVMSEAGVDISQQESQLVETFAKLHPNLVVTVCDHAAEVCPTFPGATHMVHHSFADPAQATGSEVEILAAFRKVRDEIKTFVATLPDILDRISKQS
jgi:arsenate reductase